MKTAAALLLVLPFSAGAKELELYLQYEGTIASIQGCRTCVNLKEGAPISGLVKIKPGAAPADRDADPRRGEYGNWPFWEETGPDFVTGHAKGGRSNDSVLVHDERGPDRVGPGLDFYGIRDSRNFGTSSWTSLNISIQTERNVLEGDGIVQAFDVQPMGNESFFGAIYRRVGKFATDIYLNVTRVSLTPGRCRP